MPAPRYLALAVALALAAPAGASAEPGVTVDPRSPAGQEYAVPIDAARELAAGGPHGAATPASSAGEDEGTAGMVESRSAAPLFGEGVDRSSEETPGSQRRDDRRRPSSRELIPPTTVTDGAPLRASSGPTPDDAGTRVMGTAAVAVLLAGALLALAVRLPNRRA